MVLIIIELFLLHKFYVNKNYTIPKVLPDFIINWLNSLKILASTEESLIAAKKLYYFFFNLFFIIFVIVIIVHYLLQF